MVEGSERHPGRKRARVDGKGGEMKREFLEVHLCSLWSLVAEYFELEVPMRCVQRDRHAADSFFSFFS